LVSALNRDFRLAAIALPGLNAFKVNAMRQADIIGAGRDEPLIHPVMAKVALLGDIPVHVIIDGIIRAFLHAGLASGAQIVVHDNDSVRPFGDGFCRTSLDTRWIVAVPAQVDLKYELRLIIAPPRAVFPHRNQFDTLGCPVFLLAGHLTGSAAPTELIVYPHLKFSHSLFLSIDHEPARRKFE
jgi:hypothetical protein